MAKTKIHVGLEIGTSKTCMVVGEVKPDATVTIIGVGEVPSEGVVRGEIEDTSKVIQCSYDAWNMAQDLSLIHILNMGDFAALATAMYLCYEPVKKLGAVHNKAETLNAGLELPLIQI